MIYAESITDSEYAAAVELFHHAAPELAWGLTPNPEGTKFWLPKAGVYVSLLPWADGVEVLGCFRAHGSERGAASDVVALCRMAGYTEAVLDCYTPVAQAWRRAGFVEYAWEPWKQELAPEAWRPEYGTPSVVYMRKILGGAND